MTVAAFAFRAVLSGGEVVIDSPDQGSTLKALIGAMVATSTEPEAEVTPIPLRADPLQRLAVVQGVQQ